MTSLASRRPVARSGRQLTGWRLSEQSGPPPACCARHKMRLIRNPERGPVFGSANADLICLGTTPLSDGAAAVRVRRPRLRYARRTAAADRRPALAADGGVADLRLGLRRRLAAVADALPANANRGGADHATGAGRARPDLPDRRHRAQRPPYVPGRIRDATLDELGTVPGPAWMVLPADEAAALLARRPDRLHAVMPLGEAQQWRLLRLDP